MPILSGVWNIMIRDAFGRALTLGWDHTSSTITPDCVYLGWFLLLNWWNWVSVLLYILILSQSLTGLILLRSNFHPTVGSLPSLSTCYIGITISARPQWKIWAISLDWARPVLATSTWWYEGPTILLVGLKVRPVTRRNGKNRSSTPGQRNGLELNLILHPVRFLMARHISIFFLFFSTLFLFNILKCFPSLFSWKETICFIWAC